MRREDLGVHNSLGRYQVIPRVLCFVLHGNKVLLLRGAPGKRIWANMYNGLGGHVERDEDVYAAAIREIHEESGLEVTGVRLRGVINIDPGEGVGIMLFVFLADAVTTTPRPSAEGTLVWVPLDDLPSHDLVEDITTILPWALEVDRKGTLFFGHYDYDSQENLVMTFNAASLR